MQNFPEFSGHNNGGLDEFFYIPSRFVYYFPDPVNSIIIEDIILADGYKWYKGYATEGTLSYDEPKKSTANGSVWEAEMAGIAPKDSPVMLEIFQSMDEELFIILYRDHNGELKVSGSIEEPLKFTYDLSTGSGFANRNGYKYKFAARRTAPAYFYQAAFETDTTVYTPPSSGSGGIVQIRDQDGNIIEALTGPAIFDVLVYDEIDCGGPDDDYEDEIIVE